MTDTEAKADAAAKQRTDDQKKHAEDVKKRLGEEQQAREKASEKHAKMVSDTKPTPTQLENDMAASGVYLAEHEADGSPPDAHVPPDAYGTPQNKKLEADKSSGGYQTRAATPKA
jgi:hypothetical protein